MPKVTELHELDSQAALFVQLNDVYHIDYSGDFTKENALILPRVATIIRRLRPAYDGQCVFCLAGDFLGPSALSKESKGAHMVEVLNEMGLDYASLGNHEFEKEFTPEVILKRMDESRFKWICSNFDFHDAEVSKRFRQHANHLPFEHFWLSPYQLIMLCGVLDNATLEDWVIETIGAADDHAAWIQDFIDECKKLTPQIKEELGKRDGHAGEFRITVAALTHQRLDKDIALSARCPELRLIMGGHDHDVRTQEQETKAIIVKAASNARTLRFNWVVSVTKESLLKMAAKVGGTQLAVKAVMAHYLKSAWSRMFFGNDRPPDNADADFKAKIASYARSLGFFEAPRLGYRSSGDDYIVAFSIPMDTTVPSFVELFPEDENVASLIRRKVADWIAITGETKDPIILAPSDLNLEDKVVRRQSTNFGNFVADLVRGKTTLRNPSRQVADVGLLNSGGFRIDRIIKKGEPISRKTLADIFYHENAVRLFRLSAHDLCAIIEQSLQLLKACDADGDGKFLQMSGLKAKYKLNRSGCLVRLSIHGQRTPLDPDDKKTTYLVATNDYVAYKCKSYRDWFQDKEIAKLDDDIKKAVEAELVALASLEKRKKKPRLRDVLSTERRWYSDGATDVKT